MRIISRRTLRGFWEQPGHADSERPLSAWYAIAHQADWPDTATVKDQFRSASFVGDRIIFNIGGNKYRLVVAIDYRHRAIYVKWIGSHKDYDAIDVEKV